MDFKLHTLASGLRVVTVPMPSLESITLTIWVKTGSRNEDQKVGGISHFLEHMVFKGSSKRPTARDISQAVDAIGGEFNAATSKDWTNFYIKASKENLETAFDVLSDMVLNPLIKSDEIEREKGTIIQEIKMYEDTPMMHIGDVFEELAFEGSSLGRDTAGTEKTVRGIMREDFLDYRKVHYHPENMLVTVAGGVDEKKVIDLVKKYFSSLTSLKGVTFKGQAFKVSQTKPQIKLQTKKSEQAHLVLGFMSEGRGYEKRYAQSLLSVILGGGMSSRLFIEVRERRGLAYSVRTSPERYQETGYMGTYAGVNVEKADEAVKVILDQCYGLASGKYPVTTKELAKAKGFLKGNLALALEDTHDVSGFYGEQHLFLEKVLTPEEIYKKVEAVTIQDIISEAKKLFVPEKLNLAIIGPYKDEKKFVQLLRL
ncbi:MAG TPA: pitrilysin family protein [Candidatus Saccharimonadales bacterium]|nr:pitrilysin family protein [Candidatus Saccharimonadales bacterium]